MVDVRVRGFRGDAPGLVFGRWPSHIILIKGPLSPKRHLGELDVALSGYEEYAILRLDFEDTPRPNERFSPTLADLEQVVAFARLLPERARLLVLCPGGYGRSSATALVVRVALGEEPSTALARLLEDRPRATPNRLVVALGDLALDRRGDLWRAFEEWARRTTGVRFDCPVQLRGPSSRVRARGRRP